MSPVSWQKSNVDVLPWSWVPNMSLKNCFNFRIQGTAADLMLYQNLNFWKQDTKNIWYFYCIILGQLEKVGRRADMDFGRGEIYNGHQHVSVCFSEKLFWASQVVPIKPFTAASKAASLGVPSEGPILWLQSAVGSEIPEMPQRGWLSFDMSCRFWLKCLGSADGEVRNTAGALWMCGFCCVLLFCYLITTFEPQFCVPANHPSGHGMRTWC